MSAFLDPDIETLKQWIRRTEEVSDHLTPRLAGLFAAVLGSENVALEAGEIAPPGIHWCLAPAIAPMAMLGPDGHPKRGGFLPPVSLPRRMWTGSETKSFDSFRVGEMVKRLSRVADVVLKEGRSGSLCFVTVDHEFSTPRGIALKEKQTIVYRGPGEAPRPNAQEPNNPPTVRETRCADAVLLFRYSEATSNTHRIHYDRLYCTEEENYPGLVVHGPLQGTYLWNLAARVKGRPPVRFGFRAMSPLFDGQVFNLHAEEVEDGALELWVTNPDNVTTMRARAAW